MAPWTYAVEAGADRVARRVAEVAHDARDLLGLQRARLGHVHEPFGTEEGLRLRDDCGRCHRRAATRLQARMRHAAHVPQLAVDAAAARMHGLGHLPPAIELLGAVEARHVGVALALMGDGRAFADDQPGAGALRVVLRHQRRGDGVGRAVARERRHDDSVGQMQVPHLHGFEQVLHGMLVRGGAGGVPRGDPASCLQMLSSSPYVSFSTFSASCTAGRAFTRSLCATRLG